MVWYLVKHSDNSAFCNTDATVMKSDMRIQVFRKWRTVMNVRRHVCFHYD